MHHRQSGTVATVPSKPHQLPPSRCRLGLTPDVQEEAHRKQRISASCQPFCSLPLRLCDVSSNTFFPHQPPFYLHFLDLFPQRWSHFKNTAFFFFFLWWTWYLLGRSVRGSWCDLTLPPHSVDSANPPRFPADDHDSTSMSLPATFALWFYPLTSPKSHFQNSLLNGRPSSLLSNQ